MDGLDEIDAERKRQRMSRMDDSHLLGFQERICYAFESHGGGNDLDSLSRRPQWVSSGKSVGGASFILNSVIERNFLDYCLSVLR